MDTKKIKKNKVNFKKNPNLKYFYRCVFFGFYIPVMFELQISAKKEHFTIYFMSTRFANLLLTYASVLREKYKSG